MFIDVKVVHHLRVFFLVVLQRVFHPVDAGVVFRRGEVVGGKLGGGDEHAVGGDFQTAGFNVRAQSRDDDLLTAALERGGGGLRERGAREINRGFFHRGVGGGLCLHADIGKQHDKGEGDDFFHDGMILVNNSAKV